MLAGVTNGFFSEKVMSDIQMLGERKDIQLDIRTYPADDLYGILNRGEADCLLSPLEKLPVNMPEGIAIAALTGGAQRGYCLVCHPGTLDNARPLFLKAAARVGVEEQLIAVQIAGYRPDILLTTGVDSSDLPDRWKQLSLDAIAIPSMSYELVKDNFGPHEMIPLHPREVIPSPGFGVTAYLALISNIHIRKTLQTIHDPGIGALTNVERKILKLLPAPPEALLGVYCERPRAGQYQVRAFYQLPGSEAPIRVSFSSATTFELAEMVVGEIQNKVL